ncbi:restriction endonuclease [Sporolactobacillus inulinus]|uniref:restriction endonuclease n=1 Tax=Sporolactobacillus inulinus TaxID=2078 RepID=UPI0011437340|nr:restriction endonuclease [Sporolactobacillus inulinus]GEB78519.1 hypothetical protein SIN01_28640 [Sporolactobacillus inulinus]
MNKRKMNSTFHNLFYLIVFMLMIMIAFPISIYFMFIGTVLFVFYKYIKLFRRYNKELTQLKDHFFIFSLIKNWPLRYKMLLGISLYLIVSFFVAALSNPMTTQITGILLFAIILGLLFFTGRWIYGACKQFMSKPVQFIAPIEDVDKMKGAEFEEYLAPIYRSQGYFVKVTKCTGDFGADLVLIKGNEKTVVQAKRYGGNVGVHAIYEVVGASGYYQASRKIVITNRHFTNNAKISAKKMG